MFFVGRNASPGLVRSGIPSMDHPNHSLVDWTSRGVNLRRLYKVKCNLEEQVEVSGGF